MGAWIEIKMDDWSKSTDGRRTPRWVRGLKYGLQVLLMERLKSHPTMGAWIEITEKLIDLRKDYVAPHDGCVDWNK